MKIINNQQKLLTKSKGIDECGDPNYCIFQIPTSIRSKQQRYLCHSLQLESTQYPGNRVPAKNNLGKCQDLFLSSTISCVDGFLCINDKGECQPLSINQPIARDVFQKCQPAYTDQSLYCTVGYCLLNQVCLPLSVQNPGREGKTSKCLQEGEKGVFGAIQCFQSFCLKGISDEPQDQFCAQIDFKISSQVGRYKQSQKCVKEDDNNNLVNNFKIEYCFKGEYCIRKDSQGIQFCSKVLSNDIVCSDVYGACIFSKDPIQNCSSCSYTECLNQQTKKCIPLGAVYCQDYNGFCSNFQSSTQPYCVVCPKYYCLNKRTQLCIYYKYMYNLQYSQTNCLYQFRQDEECILQDINSVNKYQENLCIDNNYFCLPIAEAQKTKNCLFCPKYYYNPGDGICYQKSNNNNYPYFNLDIQYVSEDCYPKSDCLISNQKCPEGCQKCDNLNMCTQCIEDYFLYQDKQTQNQFCIKCDTNIYTTISQDPILSQYGTQSYKCVECNIQDEDWNLNSLKYKNCAKMVVQIAGIKRFTNNYSKFLYYIIQSGNSQNLDSNQANRQLASLMIQKKQVSPFACSNLCIRCDSNPNKKPYCYRCVDYYYSDQNGICQQCPLNCQKCGRALFDQNFLPILIDDIPKEDLDQGIYDFSKSIFACIECNTQYTVSPNFNQCDQCGLYCLECAYEFQGDLVNYRKQNFRNEVYQILKCIKCKPGYTLSSNRKDCDKIQEFSNCLDQDLNDLNTGLSLRTYLDLSSNSSKQYCITCNYNSCLYNNSSCVDMSYSPRNYVYNCEYANNGDDDDDDDDHHHHKHSYYYLTTLNTCLNGSPTIYQGGSVSCDFNTECKKQIYQCLECFVSTDNTYQCKVCSQGYIPSIFGCIPCPETCQTCYEEGYINFQRVNFTNYIINTPQTTINFSLQQRLNYKNIFMIKMKCSDCKFGSFLDYTQQNCQKPQCGKYCQNCINFKDSPLCISCNYTKLFNLIAPIQGYISKLHYGTNFLSNFQQMVTFDSQQKNCQICPLLCETCEDNHLDFVLDPLSLYKVKCYSCKQQLPSNYGDMQKYEIRYDKARKRCIYCLKNDNGCYFKKKSEIFAECGTASQPLGKGTFDEPLNLYRINEINLDKFIINEPEFDISLAYFNELQLKQIDFTINFIDKSRVCTLDFALNINTNVKNKIPSIQTLSITLNANQTNSLTDYVMLQKDIATFKGFSSFKIQNMNIQPKDLNKNFGFKIYEDHIMLRKQKSIKLNIQIFSAAQITIMQGYTKMNFIQAYNTIQSPINFQTDTFFSTVINLKNVIGKLEIINSRIINDQNHPNHNLLYIQGSQIQIQNSNFTIHANNQQKLQFLSGSNSILGGIAMIQCSALKILSSIFSGGLSLQGGGLYIQATSLANIYIFQTNFTENWSFSLSDLKNSNGGAIYINQMQQNLGVTLRFIQCLFSNNFAYSKGGALYVSSSYNKFYLNLLLSNFSNNFSYDGSSLYSSQKNFLSIVQIQQTCNLYSYKYISDFIIEIEQFVQPMSISPSLYCLQGFNQVYLLQNTFLVEETSFQLNSKETQYSFIFQSLIIFDSINYLQLAQNKISNFKVQNYLLKMTNIKNLSLSKDQFFDNQQIIYNLNLFVADSMIIIQANSIKLEQIIYINNTCSKCAQGNLRVISNHILIADSTFQLNTALNGGALSISKYIEDEIITLRFLHFYSYYEEYLIRKSNQNQTIYNSTFLKNTALNNGGSILAQNTYLYIIKSKFQENNANQFGGAIVSDLNDKLDQFQKIHLIKNIFYSNKARIGSSFYQMQNLPLHYHFDNKLSQNEAQLYNNNLIQFAVQFIGIKDKQTYRKSLSINKHLSGKFKDEIVLQLVNNEDQPITTLNEEIKLKVQVLKGEDYYIDQNYISQKSGIFHIKDKINVFGRLGKQIILQISSEYAKSPIYKQDGELIKMETNISFEIEINIAEKCSVGTSYFNDTIKKDICNPCLEFMYNLNDGDKCHKCPDNFLCKKTSIYLPRGFWRSKNNSYNYIECYGYFQCVGDINRIGIAEQYSDENRYCEEGNIGALCMDCDLYGKYWNERYYQAATYTCLKCGQFNANLMIDIIVLLLNFLQYLTFYLIALLNCHCVQKI
ncbi:transmembrane protein, putative (macronuclear) [Tetrahymena thermophila SB210]|uniref:Transmembrane protein, putative n=1 Tax=Tetrahymena thermophila (strain SB210) TaxID=312017 RepID=W7X4D2_TETTS|nr:transmembrane protein, putative [Tetrahymena thermophila SB210]EWS74170.1 transmembrane protein, putative [Tetrahymena thermophila SB210]|eukprot:XP_012653291.1 transmembrane protein, putative [Tetrahymena thermophila SB210]